MAVQVDTDMERGFAQLYEIQKRFLNGSLSPRALRQPLQDLIEGKFPQEARFDRYSAHLLSLEDQLLRITGFNRKFWDGQLGSLLDQWPYVTSDHVQRVDDLELLYVDFGSPEQNVEMWWKVLAGTQPNNWRWDGLKTDPEHLRQAANTRHYEAGIHRIRINLVAHWEPDNGRSVQQVRERVAKEGLSLAHAEVLAAYGLHDTLLQQMDGDNLPYADLAGFEVTVPGSQPWTHVPYLHWNRNYREVELHAYWRGNVGQDWSAPVVRES